MNNFGVHLLRQIYLHDPICVQWIWRIDDVIMLENELQLLRKIGGNQVYISPGTTGYKIQVCGTDTSDMHIEACVATINDLVDFITTNINKTFLR